MPPEPPLAVPPLLAPASGSGSVLPPLEVPPLLLPPFAFVPPNALVVPATTLDPATLLGLLPPEALPAAAPLASRSGVLSCAHEAARGTPQHRLKNNARSREVFVMEFWRAQVLRECGKLVTRLEPVPPPQFAIILV